MMVIVKPYKVIYLVIDGIKELFEKYNKKKNTLDVLVNNAGAAWTEPLEEFSELGWDKVMDLNVKSIFFMVQKFLPMLKINTSPTIKSRVINIGSIDGINTPYYEIIHTVFLKRLFIN